MVCGLEPLLGLEARCVSYLGYFSESEDDVVFWLKSPLNSWMANYY